jgi:hypothetical protein
MSSSQPGSPTLSRWVAPAALVIAVIAIAVAIWAVVRSPAEPAASPGEPAANAQQSGDAKARICAAADLVRNAVSRQTNLDPGPDPSAKVAVAANARLATVGGGEYLLSRLDPATPPALADKIRSFANNLQEIGMHQLGGLANTDPAVAALLTDAQATSQQITDMCK